MVEEFWAKLAALPKPTLTELFATDAERVDAYTLSLADIRFDFSKTHLDSKAIALLSGLAETQGLRAAREALFNGAAINKTEGRAAEHTAERGSGSVEAVAQAKALQARMRSLLDAIEGGAFGEIKHILHIGIGGSALGPKLLIDALGRDGSQ